MSFVLENISLIISEMLHVSTINIFWVEILKLKLYDEKLLVSNILYDVYTV